MATTASIRTRGALPPPRLAPATGTPPLPPMAPRQLLTVAVIDMQAASREALPLLLPQVNFRGVFATTEQFLTALPDVDVVILEPSLMAAAPAPAAAPLRQRAHAVLAVADAGYRVLVYTGERTNLALVAALRAGALGIVHKAQDLADLDDALRRVAAGQTVITPALAGLAELAKRAHRIPTLSPRQHQILLARARGERFDSIAARLYISRRVAEEHWSAVAAKFATFLRTHSAADLERLLGLDDPLELFEDWV